jgi:hypothetical protein
MSKEATSPVFYDEVIFKNSSFHVKKICFWPGSSLWKDKETGLLRVNLPGSAAFNQHCKATIAFPDGKRATEDEYCYLDSFHEGLCLVAIKGKGYGYIDQNAEFAIPLKYYNANRFHNGFAVVAKWDNDDQKAKWLFIDAKGNEYNFSNEYQAVYNISDELFRVSNLDIGNPWCSYLSYHSDYSNNAGICGYADSKGREIIEPQYIYAFDFEDGLALVCKGKWTIDKKWDNKYNTGKYWTETELWGIIDKKGNEVVPCKFDEIKYLYSDEKSKYLRAHFGGWKEGKWGIIDYQGKWVVEPIFVDIGDNISNDDECFIYSNIDEDSNPDYQPKGVYSIKEQRIIFEPQFIHIEFLNDGTMLIENHDDKLQKDIQIIIDRKGKPVFASEYESLYTNDEYITTVKKDINGERFYGMLDWQGKELLPCIYSDLFQVIFYKQKILIYCENDKFGLMTFDGKVLIRPIYTDLSYSGDIFFEAKIGGKARYNDEGKKGLITIDGDIIIPIQFQEISIENDLIIARNDDGTTLFKIIKARDEYNGN